jgi:hypothetical protein
MRPALAFAVVLLAACASSAPKADPATALLDEAMEAAGGYAALSKVRTLRWTGEATVHAGDRRIELGVDTRVTPRESARSDTWLRDQGRATLRTLEIGPDGGAMLRDGQRTPMPAAMLAHERLQYATYALMLLAPLRSDGAQVERRPDVDGLRVLHARLPGAAPALMFFDANARLVRLEDVVPDPEGGREVAQRFDFDGTLESNGVRWPRTIRIAQEGRPYFELRLSTFEAD